MNNEKQIESTDWLTKDIPKDQLDREKQAVIVVEDLRKCLSFDEWSAREYGQTEVDYYWSALNLVDIGYRKQEWISVEDRLPKKEQIVLCCLGLVMNVYTYKGDNTWEDDYGYWQKDEPITHWMPLPEPPKMKVGE